MTSIGRESTGGTEPPRRGSVQRRIGGHAGHQGVATALAGQHLGPQLAPARRENASPAVAGSRIQSPLLKLGVELAGTPAGMAGEGPRGQQRREGPRASPRPGASPRRQSSQVRSCSGARTAPGRSRPRAARARRRTASCRAHQRLELGHDLPHVLLRGPVQDQTQRALIAVLDHQHHGAPEVRVKQRLGPRSGACPERTHLTGPSSARALPS